MSQPFNRAAVVPQPRELDPRLEEWWVENPWLIPNGTRNLSSFERNRTYLNVEGADFHDVSYITGTDNKGDGRSVVACDFTGDGMQDLIVRQVGGGALLFFENRFPKAGWLTVTLRGRESNTLGIGAQLTAAVGARRMVRDVYPHNGFNAQGPSDVHFGLGDATSVESLAVRWPTGKIETFDHVAGNRRVLIVEGEGRVRDRTSD